MPNRPDLSAAGSPSNVVDLRPVRAYHPDPQHGSPDRLICPVYDTLSESELARYAAHPHNAARFVTRPRDVPVGRFVAEAAARLDEALRSRAYVEDARPAFYVYGIRYLPPDDLLETIEPGERRARYLLLGLVGALDFDTIEPGQVAMHERTFADRVEERVALTDATGMSFAPIMAGYHRPDHALNDRLERWLGLDRRGLAFDGDVPPLAEAVLEGTTHRLWRIDEPSRIEEISRELRSYRLLVLDGHHRFTAAALRHYAGRPSAPLTMLVDGQDRALRVLPWHRVLPAHGGVSFAEIVGAARREFPRVGAVERPGGVERLVERLGEMHRDGRRGFLVLDAGSMVEVGGAPSSDVGADFDLLHGFLEGRLGVDPHELEFVRSPRAAIDRITASRAGRPGSTAFLVPGLTEKGIEERAFGSGAMMAHKSTMFLPKVADGMIFARADAPD